MDRMFLGVRIWQWVVITLMFVGFNMMVTLPMFLESASPVCVVVK